MTDTRLPLGKDTNYPTDYAPQLLYPISRSDSRAIVAPEGLPFHGTDIWNAWELTWLGSGGVPIAASAEIRVAADTPNIIESKSLKLYLNSFAMSPFANQSAVADCIRDDLSHCAGAAVDVTVESLADTGQRPVSILPGICIDTLAVNCDTWDVDASLLRSDPSDIVAEELHTHLLRSLCPVTNQPDIGSLAIHYQGPRIDPASLLQYIVSFRQHNDFHEACIERMFVDILARCGAQKLSVYARYQRRGGIDINPFRSNFEDSPKNLRLWRQ